MFQFNDEDAAQLASRLKDEANLAEQEVAGHWPWWLGAALAFVIITIAIIALS